MIIMTLNLLLTLFSALLLASLSTCSVIRRATGNIEDFSKFEGMSELVSMATEGYNSKFKTIFKDGPIFSGEGTAYGAATQGGNCLFPKDEYYDDMMYAAINKEQYFEDLGCGMCALVVSTDSPYAPIRIRVIDQCPECAHGDLDFSDKAFKALTNQSPTRVKITWALIPCDLPVEEYPPLVAPNSPMKFQFKTGSSDFWTEILVYNTKYPVAKVEVKVDDEYVSLARRDYNYWYKEGNAGLGSGPFDIRVTLADSSVTEAKNVEMAVPDADEGSAFSSGTQEGTVVPDDSPSIWLIILLVILALAIVFIMIKLLKPKLLLLLQRFKKLPTPPPQ